MNVLELASDTSPLLHACVSLLFKMGTASWMNLIGLSIICEHCYCALNMGSFISKFMVIILHFSYTVPKDPSFLASSVLNTSPHRKKKPLNCLPKNLITTVSLKHSFAWWTRHVDIHSSHHGSALPLPQISKEIKETDAPLPLCWT